MKTIAPKTPRLKVGALINSQVDYYGLHSHNFKPGRYLVTGIREGLCRPRDHHMVYELIRCAKDGHLIAKYVHALYAEQIDKWIAQQLITVEKDLNSPSPGR